MQRSIGEKRISKSYAFKIKFSAGIAQLSQEKKTQEFFD